MPRELHKKEPIHCATIIGRISNFKGEGGVYNPIDSPDTKQSVLGAVQRNLTSAGLASEEELSNPMFQDEVVEFTRSQITGDSEKLAVDDEKKSRDEGLNRVAIEILQSVGSAKAGLVLTQVIEDPRQFHSRTRDYSLVMANDVQTSLFEKGHHLESTSLGAKIATSHILGQRSITD